MEIFKDAKKASLLLQDGSIIKGYSLGSKKDAIGELVFNTSVVGFQEILTDPSNANNIVVETFPLTGNYGVNAENNLSDKDTAKGWIVREWCDIPSNFRSEGSIDKWLEEKNITAIFDIDTRALTRKVRNTKGSLLAAITTEELIIEKQTQLLEQLKNYKRPLPAWKQNETVITHEKENPNYAVTVVDYGVRKDVVNALINRGCKVTIVPASFTAEQVKATNPQGIVLCGGMICFDSLEEDKQAVNLLMQTGIPMLGIDFGHQLMGMCCDGKLNGVTLEKMQNGHRGANSPVTETATGRTFITTQNHGYVLQNVDTAKATQSHVNINDKTCEGLVYASGKALSVQFIPEAEIGRKNFDGIYEAFLKMMD